MNERLAELHNQCIVRETRGTTAFNSYVVDRFDSDKFAELIVKECISTLEEKIYQSIDNEGDEVWADLILKEHFGVEE